MMQKMKIINSISDIELSDSVGITIGNFDGTHLGHRELLASIKDDCEKNGLKLLLITFNPHPVLILNPQHNYLINTYEEKSDLIGGLGIDYYLEIPFSRDFSTLGAAEFLDNFILQNASVKKMYLGHDFCFGTKKEGDFDFAANYCKEKMVEVVSLDSFKLKNNIVSSTKIRNLIKAGDVDLAKDYLGRDFFIMGRVIRGEGRGRKIGFPTANLSYFPFRLIPSRGVYITQTEYKGNLFYSLTNIGINPTFNGASDIHVETHLIDFSLDIYGDVLKINFIKKLREEVKFASVDDLVKQINHDVLAAKSFFVENPSYTETG